MAIADFAVRPPASAWFLQEWHIQSIRIEARGMEVEEASGEMAGLIADARGLTARQSSSKTPLGNTSCPRWAIKWIGTSTATGIVRSAGIQEGLNPGGRVSIS
jgi:hypothetical protein